MIDINNYTAINSVREDRTGGGASLFIHPDIDFETRTDLKINCPDCDSVFIEIANFSQIHNKNIIVGIIYRPESVNPDDFHEELSRVLNIVNNETKSCYIMGDYNFDILKCNSDPKVTDFVNLIFSNGFFPTIDRPTRITETTATILDNILTNDLLANTISGALVTDLSDHFPVFNISCSNKDPNNTNHDNYKPPSKKARQLKPDNIKGFNNALSSINWQKVYEQSNPEIAFNVFQDKLLNTFNIHCPIKESKVSKRKMPRKPWITPGLIKSINTKDKLYKKYRSKPSYDTNIKYTKYRNILNNLLRISKRNYITAELDANRNNMKKTWQTLNNLLGRNKSPKPSSYFSDEKGLEIKDSVDIANKFNDFFTNTRDSQ